MEKQRKQIVYMYIIISSVPKWKKKESIDNKGAALGVGEKEEEQER